MRNEVELYLFTAIFLIYLRDLYNVINTKDKTFFESAGDLKSGWRGKVIQMEMW